MKNIFSRRNFIRTAALSGTALAVPVQINAASPVLRKDSMKLNENPLKLGVMTYTLAKEWDIETIIKNLSEASYR